MKARRISGVSFSMLIYSFAFAMKSLTYFSCKSISLIFSLSLFSLVRICACSSSYDFAIPSSRLYLAIHTLGVAFEFVGNYASVDFHHRALICPSYKQAADGMSAAFFCARSLKAPPSLVMGNSPVRGNGQSPKGFPFSPEKAGILLAK